MQQLDFVNSITWFAAIKCCVHLQNVCMNPTAAIIFDGSIPNSADMILRHLITVYAVLNVNTFSELLRHRLENVTFGPNITLVMTTCHSARSAHLHFLRWYTHFKNHAKITWLSWTKKTLTRSVYHLFRAHKQIVLIDTCWFTTHTQSLNLQYLKMHF